MPRARHRQPAERDRKDDRQQRARARSSASKCRPARASSRRDRSSVPREAPRRRCRAESRTTIATSIAATASSTVAGMPLADLRRDRLVGSGTTCRDRRGRRRARNDRYCASSGRSRPSACRSFGDVLRRRALAEHRLRGIAGDEMNQREHQRRDAEEDRDREQQSPYEIAQHRLRQWETPLRYHRSSHQGRPPVVPRDGDSILLPEP